MTKCLLGFDFDGIAKTVWLKEEKQQAVLAVLKGWLQAATQLGIPFKEFVLIIVKVRHAFTVIPEGRGLLSPCNKILSRKLPIVFLQSSKALHKAISNIQTLLQESSTEPKQCRELVKQHPNYFGICNASRHGIGGVRYCGETFILHSHSFQP
jgi:hypothetical protein